MSENIKKNASALFAVLHMRKIKTMAGCTNVAAHNLRQKLSKDSKEAIDPKLSRYNVYDGVQNYDEFKQKYDEKIENANLKRKIQTNASRILEFVISFSHEYCENWQEDKKQKENIDKYFKDCKEFITQKYGDVIISSTVHYDETTPHIHIMCIPFVFSEDGKEVKFSSSQFMGGRNGIKILHTDFYNKVAKSYGISRGIEGSRATHTEIKQYKAQEEKKLHELEKQRDEAERLNKAAEFQKTRIQSIHNDLLKKDAELSKKEQMMLAAERSIQVQPPEIPLPPVQITGNARKTWRDSIQKMVEEPFKLIVNAYRAIQLKYDKLQENFNKLITLNENLKKRAEKAEKDLSDKPIKEIIAEREQKKKDVQDKDKRIKKGGVSL